MQETLRNYEFLEMEFTEVQIKLFTIRIPKSHRVVMVRDYANY